MLRPYTDGVPIVTEGRPVVVDSNYPVQVVGHTMKASRLTSQILAA